MKKKILSFVLVISIMASLFVALPITANAETAGEEDITTITVGNITAEAGEEIVVPVSISNNHFGDPVFPGLCGLKLNFKYDANVLNYKGAVAGYALQKLDFIESGKAMEEGNKAFLWVGTDTDDTDGEILFITFKVVDGVADGCYGIEVDVEEATDYNINDMEIFTKDGAVTVGDHNWDEGKVTKEPVCTENGIKTYTCIECGDMKTETIPAFGHYYDYFLTKEPTCTEDGVRTFICSDCGDSYEEKIPYFGHSIIFVEEVLATHVEDGNIEHYLCTTCGKTYADGNWSEELTNVVIPALGHKFEVIEAVSPSCTKEGIKTLTCIECGYICEELEPALGHRWDYYEDVVFPTCTEDGIKTYTCIECGDVKTETIPALGHIEDEWLTTFEVIPTCTEDGIKILTCAVCGDTWEEPAPAWGHMWDYYDIVAPTCTEPGLREYRCIGCGETYEDVAPALGHDWRWQEVIKEGNCEQKSIELFKCRVCGITEERETREVHSLYAQLVIEPTCTEDGLYYVHCTDCWNYGYEEVAPAKGHSYDDGVVTTPATCTEEGVMTHTCAECGDIYTEIVPARGHWYDDGVVTTPATCTEEGVMTYTCTECGDIYTEVISAGHDYDEVTTEPTCTEDGLKTYTCTKCEDMKTQVIPATGHDYDDGVITKEPTYTSEGEKLYTCIVCGEDMLESVTRLTEGWFDIYKFKIENDEVTIIDCDESASGEITIPSSIEGYPVTKIGGYAFYECGSLTGIILPDSITTISSGSFNRCSSLTSIIIPYGVTAIYGNTFDFCTSLTSVTIPNSVTSIGWCAFQGCDGLTNITIPDSVTYIDIQAFSGCDKLVDINVSENSSSYSSIDGVLYNKDKTMLILYPVGKTDTAYDIPEGVTTIGTWAFGDSQLITINIPDSVTSIEEHAFVSCTSLVDINVDWRNEKYCSKNGILFNEDRTEIIKYGMARDESTYYVPYSVESIGFSAFWGCNLTSIVILGRVKTIGEQAFGNCENLTDVYYPGTEEEWNDVEIETNNSALLNATIHFEHEHEHVYEVSTIWSEPTCTREGDGSLRCVECDWLTEGIIPALGHSWDEGVVTTAPTEVEDGVMTYTCTRCEDTYTEVLPATVSHEWDSGVVTKEPTCAEEGIKTYTCNECGMEKTKTIPMVEHEWTLSQEVEPTCTEAGAKTFACTVCWDERTEIIPATGHAWNTETKVCENCGTIYQITTITVGNITAEAGDEITVTVYISNNHHGDPEYPGLCGLTLNFKYDENVLKYQSAEGGEALRNLDLTKPGKLFNEGDINFNWDGMDADSSNGEILLITFKVADDANDGNYTIDVTVKDACDYWFDDIETIAVDGTVTVMEHEHNWDDGVVTKEPTTTEEGVKTYTCIVCDETKTETIEKLPSDTHSSGDANGDGIIDVKDVISIRYFIADGYDVVIDENAANANKDEIIDIKDAIYIRQYIAGGYNIEL